MKSLKKVATNDEMVAQDYTVVYYNSTSGKVGVKGVNEQNPSTPPTPQEPTYSVKEITVGSEVNASSTSATINFIGVTTIGETSSESDESQEVTFNANETNKEATREGSFIWNGVTVNWEVKLPASIKTDDLTKGDFVDLGLSVKWATCNVGAENPCDYGKYFQWGDTVGYTDASHSTWDTAPFNGGSSDYDESYFNAHKSEWLDGDVLKPQYDAAYQASNGAMRMPTQAELEELTANTTSKWCTCTVLGEGHQTHNVNGRLFTASNGNSIFIPAAGYASNGSLYNQGSFGNVWSSSLNTSYPFNAWELNFSSGSQSMNGNNRCYGFSVRGVSE